MTRYKNSKQRTLSVEGGTVSDKAILMWNNMNFMERYEVMQKVYKFKSSRLYENCCINYVAEFMI